MSKSQKIRDAFVSNPDAKPAALAKKYGAPLSMVYRLRKEVQSYIPVNEEIMKHFATTTDDEPSTTLQVPPGAGTVETSWTATSNDQGDIVATLTARGHRYGKFSGHAQVTQEIKRVMSRHAIAMNKTFTDSQWEALEMIAHKIGRIVNGDPNYADSWVDIAGYAKLVADELEGVER